MGIVWEAYHKGVPLLGVPRISFDKKVSYLDASWVRCCQIKIPTKKIKHPLDPKKPMEKMKEPWLPMDSFNNFNISKSILFGCMYPCLVTRSGVLRLLGIGISFSNHSSGGLRITK